MFAFSLPFSVLLLLACDALCCEIPSFQNALVVVYQDEYDHVGKDITVDGCLGPAPEIVETSRIECTFQRINTLHEGAVANISAWSIIFNNNGMQKVEAGAFFDLGSLNTLDMSKNKIEEILAGVFSPLIGLQKLILSNNQIRKIHRSAFANMANLKELFLKQNQITDVDSSWFRNNAVLDTIHLHENLISYIPEGLIKPMKNLRSIYFKKNKIADIHPGVFSATDQLYTLDLSENRLKKLHPDVFASFGPKTPPNSFAGIQNLYLHRNNLTYLPQKVMDDLSVNQNMFYINLHSNPWQCACYKKIERWAIKRRAGIDVFNIGCLYKKNPLCVVSTTPDQCIEEVDEELYKIYYSQYREVSEADRFDFDITCFGS